MEFTLTYQGPLPATQRGVSPVKSRIRRVLHPQIKAALDPRLTAPMRPRATSTIGGFEFIAPVTRELTTAAHLHVLLLTPPSVRVGDADNRLKTLIDGLTRPANAQQLQNHEAPPAGGPTYCLLEDDRLVERINFDTRRWHGASDPHESLVVVTATIGISVETHTESPVASLLLVM